MDIELFTRMLSIDSTSGRERGLIDFLAGHLAGGGCRVEQYPADAPADAPVNLLFAWGDPEVVFCTHTDTVPPYIAPSVDRDADGGLTVRGRGSCDAKGQIMAMHTACMELASQGKTGFGLLLLHGEETGSFGAKEFRSHRGAPYLIVGEPTGNRMVEASKGTKSFGLTVRGRSVHSGYPHLGRSAVERFVDTVNTIRSWHFDDDETLGATTYNIGRLESANAQNVVSDLLTCRVYFRTTFASDAEVTRRMLSLACDDVDVEAYGGDSPMRYLTLPGFATTTAAFGSDTPQLTNFEHRALCGPGSILTAHTAGEHVRVADLEEAARMYVRMFDLLTAKSGK